MEISCSSGCDYSADSVADSVEGCASGYGEEGSVADSSEGFALGFCCDNEAAIVEGFYVGVVIILFDEGWRFASYLCFGCGCV